MKTRIALLSTLSIILIATLYFTSQPSSEEAAASDTTYQELYTGPAKYALAHHLIRTSDDPNAPSYGVGDRLREYRKAKAQQDSRSGVELDWIQRGPGNVAGRTRGLIVDPADTSAQTWFVASVGGGIWHTSDAGETWENLTQDLTSLATSTIAMAASNTDVLYIGTGEGYRNIDAIVGTGIWKSSDRGASWEVLSSTSNNRGFEYISRLIIDPDNEDVVLASTRTARYDDTITTFIQKSIDGGMTWSATYSDTNTYVDQIIASPNDFNVLYATVNGKGVLQSKDAGDTWSFIWEAQGGEERIEMAISSEDDGVAYLSCEVSSGSRLFYTRDTFNTVTQTIYEGRQPDWLVGQGWYDNTIAVHPYNDSIVWAAGQGTMMELRGGTEYGSFKRYDHYINETDFIVPIDNSPFQDDPVGPATTLYDGLPLSLEITEDDIIDIQLRMGEGIYSKAHLIDFNQGTFQFTYMSMIDVPFQAWDTTNNQQIAMSVIDVDGDGEWTFEDLSGQSDPFHDVVVTNNVPYSETPNETIEGSNPLYKSQYYFFMGRSPDYTGPRDTLPEGFIYFNTSFDNGLISSFQPITDGYWAYADISPVGSKGVHVDHHNIIFIPRDEDTEAFYVLNANDGGIAFSRDRGETFTQTGDGFNDGSFTTLNGYNTSQFYGIDKKSGEDRYIGGTQDNGSWISPPDPDETSVWVDAPSGDGFEAAWHAEDPNQILETSQFNGLYKSNDEGETWDYVWVPGNNGPFLTRLASSKINPDLVFMVSDTGVLRSADFGDTWEIIDMPDTWEFHRSWGPPIAISLANPDVVWTGARMNDESKICYSTDGGLTFQEASNFDGAGGIVTGITTHPNDPNTAYVLFSQRNRAKVLVTHDLGENWSDLSGFEDMNDVSTNGFPNVAVYSLLVMPFDEEWIWAGTEIGLFESTDGGDTWTYADNGLPAVSIWQMVIVDDEIVFATHGSGIWSVDVEELQLTSTTSPKTALKGSLDLFPNPIYEQGMIAYELKESQHIELSLVSLNGQKLRSLYQGEQIEGTHTLSFNRNGLQSGMYFIQLTGERGQLIKKLIFQ